MLNQVFQCPSGLLLLQTEYEILQELLVVSANLSHEFLLEFRLRWQGAASWEAVITAKKLVKFAVTTGGQNSELCDLM